MTEMGYSENKYGGSQALWLESTLNVLKHPFVNYWTYDYPEDWCLVNGSTFEPKEAYYVLQSYATAVEPEPPVQAGCMLQAATQGTMLAGCLPFIRAFRDRCLPSEIIKDYYAISKYLAPKITQIRGGLRLW